MSWLDEARRTQNQLREQVVPHPPAGWTPRLVGGADLSMNRGSDRGYAAIVVLDLATLAVVDQASAVVELPFPYVPGFLSFRELPAVVAVWEQLQHRPDVLVFDGQGYAHPRRFGIACHGGVTLGVPSIGCAKSLLVGRHELLREVRGSTSPLVHRAETVGMAVRTRDRTNPLYVSIGHLMDLPTAVELVLRLCPRYREPETTRRAHQLVNRLRREDQGAA